MPSTTLLVTIRRYRCGGCGDVWRRKDDPLYRARRTLQTGADLLTDKQKDHLADLFDAESHGDTHVEVEATPGDIPADDRRLPRT